jgi:hypothetical protein
MGGLVPPRRLDFTLVLIELPHKFEKMAQDPSHGDSRIEQKEGETAIKKSTERAEPYVPYILLHGGMDETGHIYDDFYVMSLGLRLGKDVILG